MSRPGNAGVWESFWATGGRAQESGCLPNAFAAIDGVERECWQAFAKTLPRGARVLDLGTGDGTVLGKMRAVRPDLKLTGVDSSTVLPPARPGLELKAGVAMERLPFPDRRFDAVVSQFGLEYSDMDESVTELARVLRDGGRCRLIVHHRGGRILAHNLARLDGLAWAARDSGLVEKARNLAKARKLAPLPTPPAFAEAVAEAGRRFPAQGVAEEFARAVKETLDRGRHDPKGMVEVLDTLESRAMNEIGRIEALAAATRDRAGIEALCGRLGAAGLATSAPTELHEQGSGKPFAWLVDAGVP